MSEIKFNKENVLSILNQNDQLDTLDPDGICSYIKFTDITSKNGNIYLSFSLDVNGQEMEEYYSYESKVSTIENENGELDNQFITELVTKFSEFMIDSFRDY